MKSKHIAAIEIGSSRIKGIVAAVDDTAAIRVLAVEEDDSGENVRYGRVQNGREAGNLVNEIIRRLENNPNVAPGRITSVFVANGGRSLSSSKAEASVSLGGEAEITRQTLERLHKEARYNLATDRDVLAIAPRRFVVDNAEVKKIVGAFGNMVRGEFTIVTASPENRRALDRVSILSHDEAVPREYLVRFIAQADMALTDSDAQLGCLFIDFGAETTTLAIYKGGTLQAASVLPMGSANITLDICAGLSTTAEVAENIKISKGRAVIDRINIQAPDDETREVIQFVSARAGEIVANINNFIEQAGFKPAELAAGIVITGGGARLKGFNDMLEAQTKLKVRPAAVDASILMSIPGNPADHFDVISLVKYAADHSDRECVTYPEGTPEPEAPAQAAPVFTQPQQPTQRPVAAGTRRNVALDDPDLLKDDMDDDDDYSSINEDTNLDDLAPDETPEKTRQSLLSRIKNWIAPTIDDVDRDEDDE